LKQIICYLLLSILKRDEKNKQAHIISKPILS
jgi:hypothetical protein